MVFTSCGTMMEPSRKTINITVNKKAKVRYDGELVGNGKYSSVFVENRRNDKMLSVEDLDTGEVRNVSLDYEFNTWVLWDPFIDWGIISIPVDLINGSYKRLGRRSYYVQFDEDNSGNSKKDEEMEKLSKELEKIKLRNEIKKELELERTKERVLKLEATR